MSHYFIPLKKKVTVGNSGAITFTFQFPKFTGSAIYDPLISGMQPEEQNDPAFVTTYDPSTDSTSGGGDDATTTGGSDSGSGGENTNTGGGAGAGSGAVITDDAIKSADQSVWGDFSASDFNTPAAANSSNDTNVTWARNRLINTSFRLYVCMFICEYTICNKTVCTHYM